MEDMGNDPAARPRLRTPAEHQDTTNILSSECCTFGRPVRARPTRSVFHSIIDSPDCRPMSWRWESRADLGSVTTRQFALITPKLAMTGTTGDAPARTAKMCDGDRVATSADNFLRLGAQDLASPALRRTDCSSSISTRETSRGGDLDRSRDRQTRSATSRRGLLSHNWAKVTRPWTKVIPVSRRSNKDRGRRHRWRSYRRGSYRHSSSPAPD